MASDRSRAALLKFLDYLKDKGLLNGETAKTRKAAANKVLVILTEDEAKDVLALDIGDLMVRFSNLEGQGYTPGSLNTYQSRLKSALEDFESYLSNPLAFKPGTQPRERKAKPKDEEKATAAAEPVQTIGSSKQPTILPSNSIMPIQLRPDLTVYIQGLPFDLSAHEARKLANVILALAQATP